MKEITLAVMYKIDDTTTMECQIAKAKMAYCPEGFVVTGVEFDREYLFGKTRIAFKGVQNEPTV